MFYRQRNRNKDGNGKKRGWSKASMAVEASLCVPLFFLVLFSLFYLFQMLYIQNNVQYDLYDSIYQYETCGVKKPLHKESGKVLLYRWDDTKNICTTTYVWKIPYISSKLFPVLVKQQAAYSSYEGESMQGSDKEDCYVYVCENGTVYHSDRNCTYLNPGIQAALFSEVSAKRNRSGAKYYACPECAKKEHISPGDYVYITPYGTSYHTSMHCPGLKRTVKKVKKSEVGGLPPCSKCGDLSEK